MKRKLIISYVTAEWIANVLLQLQTRTVCPENLKYICADHELKLKAMKTEVCI